MCGAALIFVLLIALFSDIPHVLLSVLLYPLIHALLYALFLALLSALLVLSSLLCSLCSEPCSDRHSALCCMPSVCCWLADLLADRQEGCLLTAFSHYLQHVYMLDRHLLTHVHSHEACMHAQKADSHHFSGGMNNSQNQ